MAFPELNSVKVPNGDEIFVADRVPIAILPPVMLTSLEFNVAIFATVNVDDGDEISTPEIVPPVITAFPELNSAKIPDGEVISVPAIVPPVI